MNEATLKAMVDRRVTITVATRDLGNGSEEFIKDGRFTGDVDTWGKWTFQPEQGPTHYLFADEVLEVEDKDQTDPVLVRREGVKRHTLLFASEVVASFPTGKLALQAGEKLDRAFRKWQSRNQPVTA